MKQEQSLPVMACTGTNWVRCHSCPATFPPPKLEDNDVVEGDCPLCNKRYTFSWKDLP